MYMYSNAGYQPICLYYILYHSKFSDYSLTFLCSWHVSEFVQVLVQWWDIARQALAFSGLCDYQASHTSRVQRVTCTGLKQN